jgi:hypothetical protein
MAGLVRADEGIDEDDVRLGLPYAEDARIGILSGCHDLEVFLGVEQCREALPKEAIIFDEND